MIFTIDGTLGKLTSDGTYGKMCCSCRNLSAKNSSRTLLLRKAGPTYTFRMMAYTSCARDYSFYSRCLNFPPRVTLISSDEAVLLHVDLEVSSSNVISYLVEQHAELSFAPIHTCFPCTNSSATSATKIIKVVPGRPRSGSFPDEAVLQEMLSLK